MRVDICKAAVRVLLMVGTRAATVATLSMAAHTAETRSVGGMHAHASMRVTGVIIMIAEVS